MKITPKQFNDTIPSQAGWKNRRSSFTIKMAPMIDIVFLLLIFFLVTAKWKSSEQFLPFDLPQANAQNSPLIKPDPLILKITTETSGCSIQFADIYRIRINELQLDKGLVELVEKLKLCLEKQKRVVTDPVEISADGKLKWQYLARIYNLLVGTGFTDITFNMTESAENDTK